MYEKLTELCPTLVNKGHVLLHHDNAKPHTAKKVKAKIEALEDVELLQHPASSDYLGLMAHFLRWLRSKNIQEIESERGFFKWKDKT